LVLFRNFASFVFKDPAIFVGPDGRYQMVLGSRDPQGGVMLLYGTDDPLAASGWQFQSVLFRDSRFGMAVG
jgi:beta-fructofuranosidase